MRYFAAAWVGLASIVGIVGSARGRSWPGWFLLAIVLSPPLAFFILMMLPNVRMRDIFHTELRAHVSASQPALEGNVRKIRKVRRAGPSAVRALDLALVAATAVLVGLLLMAR
jgi:hypothetical protein